MGWPRTVAAYLETHRQPDGSIAVVECLRPYLGGVEVHHRPSLTSRSAATRNATPGEHGMQKFWSWLAVNLGKRAGIVVDRRPADHGRPRLRHHQARVRHRPGQLPQQGRGGLQGQRRLPGPLRRPGHAHAGHAGRGPHVVDLFTPENLAKWTSHRRRAPRRRRPHRRRRHAARRRCSSPTTSCCQSPTATSLDGRGRQDPPRRDRARSARPRARRPAPATSVATLERVNAIPPRTG